jgi:hypothetical protein
MTEQEMRLADYRRQVEAKDAEIRALSAHEHALFESLRRCRRVIDVLLERLELEPKLEPKSEPEPGPEPKPEMVRIWDKFYKAWWRPNGKGYTSIRHEAGLYCLADAEGIVRRGTCDVELQPVARRKVIVTVEVEDYCEPAIGSHVAFHFPMHPSKYGVVVRVEVRDAD